MDLKNISLSSIKSLGDLIGPKSKEGQTTNSENQAPNSLADLVPGSRYNSTRILLTQLNKIEQEIPTSSKPYNTVIGHLVENNRLNELERFIDNSLINFNPTETETNPLTDFITRIGLAGDMFKAESHDQILRIVSKTTNPRNANYFGSEEQTPLACLKYLKDEALAIKLADILIDQGQMNLQTDKTGDRGMPYVLQVLINDGDPILKLQLAKHLIAKGASITDPDPDGNNVLHLLNEHYNPITQIKVAEFAIQHGVRADATNSSGLNSVEVALEQGLDQSVIKTLDPHGELSSETFPSLFNLLDQKDYEGIKARLRISTEDIDNLNSKNKTLLYAVIDASSSRDDEISRAASLDMVQFLLDQGANPNIYLTDGGYLARALFKKREDIAHVLLDKGASPDLLYSDFTDERNSIAMVASLGTLKAPPELINKIKKQSPFSNDELRTLKGILDVLITGDNRKYKPKASEQSKITLAKLGIEKLEGQCIFSKDLTRAFNQIMLNPILSTAYTDFDRLADNYHGRDNLDARLKLIQFGYDFASTQILRIPENPKKELALVQAFSHINKAVLGFHYNHLSGRENYDPKNIAASLRQAKDIADEHSEIGLTNTIYEIMVHLGLPTFE